MNTKKICTVAVFFLSLLFVSLTGFLSAKSLYVINNLNSLSPISAYDIQPAPTYLVLQKTQNLTRYSGVGLAIDTDSKILFVTHENSGVLDIVDATTLTVLGTVTAPNATNLAGIVVDQDLQKVYAVNRSTNHLYVYSWNAVTKTLTNDITTSPYYISLPGISQAYGIALDEVHDLLYVGDLTTSIKVINTGTWTSAATVPVSQPAMGVAVDVTLGYVYSGNAYTGYYGQQKLCKYDLNTSTETFIYITELAGGVSSDNVLGLAVDPATTLLYITTGNQASGGSDRIIVFDSDLSMLDATDDIGDPTGIVVPGKEISYNPLNLTKSDGLTYPSQCVSVNQNITYNLHYDNVSNNFAINNAVMTDVLPPEVDFVSASGGGVYNSGTVTWTIGNIPANDPGATYQLVVQIKSTTGQGTTITNGSNIDSDETPPTTVNEQTMVCLNSPPTADAGADQTIECTSGGGASVTLDGSGSSDPDNDPLIYTWKEGSTTIATGVNPTVTLNCGVHEISLTVSDGSETDDDNVTITIQDTQSPTITVSETPITLWPANHSYFTIPLSQIVTAVSDNCDGDIDAADIVIHSVWSDEPEDINGNGDGNTLDDIVIATDCKSVNLRKERAGSANGRVYTINLKVTDASGNIGTAIFKVTVPHDQSGPAAIDDGPSAGYTELSNCSGLPKVARDFIPNSSVLLHNYPNPFNPSTNIQYSIPEDAHVAISVYDMYGRKVTMLVNIDQKMGTYSVVFDASGFPTGMYICKLETGGTTITRLMSLIK